MNFHALANTSKAIKSVNFRMLILYLFLTQPSVCFHRLYMKFNLTEMQIRIVAAVVLAFFVFIACEKVEVFTVTENSEKFTGYWVNRQINDTVSTYERRDELIANDYGFAFLPGGSFIERKNSGWCGTPPIAYADFDGTWLYNDSIVTIITDYWGGTATYRWRVISADDERLKIEVISEQYSQEN